MTSTSPLPLEGGGAGVGVRAPRLYGRAYEAATPRAPFAQPERVHPHPDPSPIEGEGSVYL